ncbi:MAG: response regulator [Opitutales bacterium]|nr:response regulator [Opitutales bacterium]
MPDTVQNPLRILFAEDSDDDAELVLHELRRHEFEVTHTRVDNAADFASSLRDGEWEIILCDYSMPGFDALEALRILETSGRDIPLIIVSGTIGEEVAVEALKHGAHDYILKDRLSRLIPAIKSELRTAEARRQQKRIEAFANSQSAVLEMILAGNPLADILADIARRLEALSERGGLCMVTVAESDGGGRFKPAAAPSLPSPFLRALRSQTTGDDNSSCARAAASGKNAVIFDIETELTDEKLRTAALEHGLKSCWSAPVRSTDGIVLGTVIVFHRFNHSPTPEEVRYTEAAARLASLAIERVRQSEKLRRSEARVSATFAAAPSGIGMTTTKGRFLLVNPALCKMLGYAETELLRLDLISVTHDEDRVDIRRVHRAMADGKSLPKLVEVRGLRADGASVWLRMAIAYVEGTDVDTDGRFIVLMDDITERRSLEQQFLRAQRMESIGTLAGGMAHDLNNILSPILMSVDLLLHQRQDGEGQMLLERIAANAKRASEVVSLVLSFARGVEGRRVTTQIRHVINDVVRIARETFPRNIEIRESLCPELEFVVGDPTQLHQVILNLCVNARDAMCGGGTLQISACNTDISEDAAAADLEAEPGAYVLVEVKDSGHGIPDRILDKIFDPFFTTKEQGKGTGLGLSTSLAIVKSHGGFIRAQSDPGRGTVFQIHLPARTEGAETAMEKDEEKMEKGDGETILVIDDEASLVAVMRDTLEAFGYRVLTAADGAEGVRVFADHLDEIDVVLVDMMMPVMDGASTIHAIRKIAPNTRFIAVSGVPRQQRQLRDKLPSVSVFLSKPYATDTLLDALRKCLATGRKS